MNELPPIAACDCVDHLINYAQKYDAESNLYIYAATDPCTGSLILRGVRHFPRNGDTPSRKHVLAVCVPEEYMHDHGGLNIQNKRRIAINAAVSVAAHIDRATPCEPGARVPFTPLHELLPEMAA